MDYKIVSDSCLDYNSEIFDENFPLERVPLKITIDGVDYLDINQTISDLLKKINYKAKKISTACPSPSDFYNAFLGAKDTFVITLSSELSGSFQSAMAAKRMLEEELKEKVRVHIFDSKSAATGQDLIAMKIKELLDKNESYASVIVKTNEYIKKMKTIFSLESLDTLVSNGRVSIAKQYITKAFKLFPIMEEDGNGKIIMNSFARGEQNALIKLIDTIGDYGKDLSDRILGITHINAPEKSELVKTEVEKRYNFKDIVIFEAGGLSSIYGSNKGIILAF